MARNTGIETDSVAKQSVTALLERDDLTDDVRGVLQLRADAGRSSVTKLASLAQWACADNRVRGMALFHGASTGRWTGKGPQPHNFPRGEVENVEMYIPDVLAGDYDFIDLMHHPIVVVTSMLRGCLTTAPGHDLIVADFSAIEARVLNWLAGQADVVELFRRGEDVYKHNAAKLYGIPLSDVQKFPHRQTGKFQELGCGYQMGHRKAVAAAKEQYGLEIDEGRARQIVDDYRSTHDRVVALWKATEGAVIEAVRTPGRYIRFGAARNLRFVVVGGYLCLQLPSGRWLFYAEPHVVDVETPWGTTKPQVQVMAVSGYSKRWEPTKLYGGLLVENIVQATSRDLLAEAMFRAEAAGYPVVMHVHDELVAEVPEGFGSVEEFEQLVAALPEWAEGCPIAAEGWRGKRYRK